MKFGYIRVSTKFQNESRQISALEKFVPTNHIIIEKASGKNFERPEYQRMKNLMLRTGDELYITSIDRLGRNKEQILEELRELKILGVQLKILDIPVTLQPAPTNEIAKLFFDTMTDFLIQLMASLAEAERITTRQRQLDGIEEWRRTGKTKTGRPYGRPKLKIPPNFDSVISLWLQGKITANKAMQLTGLKRTSFYKLVKPYLKNQ